MVRIHPLNIENRPSRLTIPELQIRAHCSKIPQGDEKYNPYTDAGRLTRIFLDDFLGPPVSERSIPPRTLSYQPWVQTVSTYDSPIPRVVASGIYPPSDLGGASSSPRENYTYSYSSSSRPADNYPQRTAGPSAHPSRI